MDVSTTHAPEGENDAPKPQATIYKIGSIHRTNLQIGMLLSVCDKCSDMLARTEEIGHTTTVDRAAVEAASSTYALAQQRLRDIIDDTPRWTLDLDPDESIIRDTLLTNRETARISAQNAQLLQRRQILMARPCVVFCAQVKQLPGGKFAAYLGSFQKSAVVGIGDSASEAMIDFDVKFSGQSVPRPAKSGKKANPPS